MKRVTWLLAVLSTGALLITIAKGMGLLKGQNDLHSHLAWGMATLVLILLNNLMAIVHITRGARLIETLRAQLEKYRVEAPEQDL